MAIDRSRTETTRDFTAHTRARSQLLVGEGASMGRECVTVCAPFLAMACRGGFVVAVWECERTGRRATEEV
jgi:hypothetical protein